MWHTAILCDTATLGTGQPTLYINIRDNIGDIMDILLMTFGVPFLIGITLGFFCKGYLNRYEKRKEFNKHMDDLFKGE